MFGRAESGKTTWLRDELKRDKGNVIAWDATNGLGSACRWDFEGGVFEFLRAQAASPKRIRRARLFSKHPAAFRALCEYVASAGDCLFAVDEAHIYVPTTIAADHPFKVCMVAMRHLKLRLILVAWRPTNVAAYTRSSYSRVLAFSLTDAASLKWLRDETAITKA